MLDTPPPVAPYTELDDGHQILQNSSSNILGDGSAVPSVGCNPSNNQMFSTSLFYPSTTPLPIPFHSDSSDSDSDEEDHQDQLALPSSDMNQGDTDHLPQDNSLSEDKSLGGKDDCPSEHHPTSEFPGVIDKGLSLSNDSRRTHLSMELGSPIPSHPKTTFIPSGSSTNLGASRNVQGDAAVDYGAFGLAGPYGTSSQPLATFALEDSSGGFAGSMDHLDTLGFDSMDWMTAPLDMSWMQNFTTNHSLEGVPASSDSFTPSLSHMSPSDVSSWMFPSLDQTPISSNGASFVSVISSDVTLGETTSVVSGGSASGISSLPHVPSSQDATVTLANGAVFKLSSQDGLGLPNSPPTSAMNNSLVSSQNSSSILNSQTATAPSTDKAFSELRPYDGDHQSIPTSLPSTDDLGVSSGKSSLTANIQLVVDNYNFDAPLDSIQTVVGGAPLADQLPGARAAKRKTKKRKRVEMTPEDSEESASEGNHEDRSGRGCRVRKKAAPREPALIANTDVMEKENIPSWFVAPRTHLKSYVLGVGPQVKEWEALVDSYTDLEIELYKGDPECQVSLFEILKR